MAERLFRQEVSGARRSTWLGDISLVQPMSVWIAATFAITFIGVVVIFLTTAEYTRRSRVSGQLTPDLGLLVVTAPTRGVVSRLFVEEGDQAMAGSPLALIDIPKATASGADAVAAVRNQLLVRRRSTERLGSSQISGLEAELAGQSRQVEESRVELRQIEREISNRGEQVRIGNETVQRYERILDQQYVSQVQLNQQRQAVLELISQKQSLERQATSIRRTIAQFEQSMQELRAQRETLLATTRRDLAALDQERVEQDSDGNTMIKAPLTGSIANRLVDSGQTVEAGQSLFDLVPTGSKLRAQLLVPSNAVGFIKPGDQVLLRYEAYPFQKFGHQTGKVLRISNSATHNAGSSEGQAYYRVLVILDRQSVRAYGEEQKLRPGMLLDADILGERRKLYEWALEPLYSLRR